MLCFLQSPSQPYSVQEMNNKQREEARTLELLQAIQEGGDVTQRHLADRMGVALGLANSYLKRCVRKGLVKIQQAPANRFLYYLTPQGFAEKSRLTAEYLSYSFSFYRSASDSCAEVLAACQARGLRRVGLYGASDLAEIAAMKALEAGVEIVCVCDPATTRERVLQHRVLMSLDAAPRVDAWLFTALEDPASRHDALVTRQGADRVFAPSILGLDPEPGNMGY